MKTLTQQHLTRITMIAAVAAAGFTTQATHAASNPVRVIQLPSVVVTAKRIPVLRLETVVITAKRLTPATTVVAQRGARTPPV